MVHRQDGMPPAVRVAVGVLIAGLALLTAHNWLHMPWPPVLPGSWWNWLYNALEIGAVGLCGARAVVQRRNRAAWSTMTIGIAFFAAADVYYTLAFENVADVPVPSFDDA